MLDAQAFCERDRPELAFWGFEAELACPSDVAHPYRVTRSRLLVLGVANLLAEARPPEEVRAQLESLLLPICYPGGLQKPPAFDLLAQRTTLKNELDSFLGSCKSDALAVAIGGESARPFSDAIISGNIIEILERIDADASATESWLSLVPFLVGAPPSDDQGARLAKAFAKLQPTELAFREAGELFVIGALLFCCSTRSPILITGPKGAHGNGCSWLLPRKRPTCRSPSSIAQRRSIWLCGRITWRWLSDRQQMPPRGWENCWSCSLKSGQPQQLVHYLRITFDSCFSKNLHPADPSGRTS
jgi:hypothetical protein